MISKAVIPSEDGSIYKDRVTGAKSATTRRIYHDKATGIDLVVVEIKRYYPQGQLAIERVDVNMLIYSFKSYKPDGTILSEIYNYKGRLILPNLKGEVFPKDTVLPFSKCNCYYDHGAFLTEEEFNSRKTEKFKKELGFK